MKIDKIPYKQTGYFSKLVIDYLDESDAIKPFYIHSPRIESFESAIEKKLIENIDRHLLVQTISQQYVNLELTRNVDENIQSFKDEKTFCIVTAHQLNIFTGPLYVLYKTISTINLCRSLKEKFNSYHFVPVFWLGSEDHDFEEINSITLLDKTFTWNDKQGGACGRYNPQSLSAIIDEIKLLLGENENASYLIDLFSNAYLHQTDLAQSTRYILNEMFGEHGLVIIDGDDKSLKAACSEITRDELLYATSYILVNHTLQHFPHPPQAKPREINLFYLKESLRERIIWNDQTKKYVIKNSEIEFTKDEILEEAAKFPERFSPNVILRPIFQQKVLPSLAYIGGGGEVAYWLQLKSLFEHYQINFPVVVLRNSALWIDAKTSQKIDKLKINIADVFKGEDELINYYLKEHFSDNISLQSQKESVIPMLNSVLQQAIKIDVTLEKTVLAERQQILNSLEKLEAKMLKAEKQRSENTVNQLRLIKQKLFQHNQLQERSDNFMSFYIKHGKNFINTLMQNFSVPSNEFVIISEE